ncbi:MAG: hypothetical protein K9J17_07005 [Flavobacteriales bacterium]|nr:hypothetical protein [Flavobacteriales bacterium]
MPEDEDEKPYTSFQDWKKEVAHLKWPSIISLILLFILIVLYDVFF